MDNLKTFLVVVDTGSFSGAARHMKVAVSVVKKRVDQLEAQVGIRLFDRSTRRMDLTDAGRRHLLKTRTAVNQVDQLLAQMAMRQTRLEGFLRVKVPTTLLMAYLGDILNRFLALHPGISMEVLTINRPVNPVQEGFDVAIGMLPMTWPGVADFGLAAMKRQVVAAPSYLARRGTPKAPRDLAGHDILNYDVIGMDWSFEGPTGPVEVRVDPKLSTNNGHFLMNAARVGQGITLLSTYLIEPCIQKGELVPLLEEYSVPDLWIRMQIPEDRREFSHVQALSAFLMENIKTPVIQGEI